MKRKRFFQFFTAFVLAVMATSAPLVGDLDNDGKITISDITELINVYLGTSSDFDMAQADLDGDDMVTVEDITQLIEVYLADSVAEETAVFNDTIYVTYRDTVAEVSTLPTDGSIVASISGSDVELTSTVTDREICCVLAGSSDAGSFVWNGSYKMAVRLNGLTLTGSSEEAINIKCGKRIALELADGTVNTLADAPTDGGQKAAFYTKGHLEISGGGTLNLCGNVKHGLSSKEYMLIKKTAGAIHVLSAAKDGIHAGQYFKMNGGEVTVSGQGDDAIQAEATSDATDEDNGQLIIQGGTLNLTVSATSADALKCDSLLTIADGTLTVNTTAAANKGIKTDGNVNIQGGTINITQTGGKLIGTDLSYSTGIKAAGDIAITGGTVTIVNTADGGKGISADGNIVINEETSTVTLDITANGAGGTAELTEDTTTTVEPEEVKSYVVYVALPTTTTGGGGMGPGGGGMGSNYWTTLYLYKSDGTLVQQLTNTVTKTSGSTTKTFYYYDFKEADSGTYYFKSADYTSQGRGGGGGGGQTTYAIQSSTFTGPTTGEDYYYEISSSRSSSGSTYTFRLTNVTNTWNGSTTDISEDNGVSYNAAGLKADGNITIQDGKNDINEQSNQIDAFIADGVDALIINLVDPSNAPTVTDKVVAAGIPLVYINREPDEAEEQRWADDSLDVTYVGCDARQSGTMQGEIIADLGLDALDFNGDGDVDYIMIEGDPENVDAQYRTEYSVKALEDAGLKVECLDDEVGNWDQATAQGLVANALAAHPETEVVFCNNDAMGLGALQAIEAAGRTVNKDIYLVGVDALTEALEDIKADKFTGTVFNDHLAQAYNSALAAKNFLDGTGNAQYIGCDYVKVTTDNVDDIMEMVK